MSDHIKIYDVEQGTEEWLRARRGILTASTIKNILTPTLKQANNPASRAYLYELLAQSVTDMIEPQYQSDDMLRGHFDEHDAREIYGERHFPVEEAGFITNSKWGFTLGYSPDGLVGSDGLIEIKSRRAKFQAETIVNHVPAGTIPSDYVLQVQAALLISEREWCDFISFCAGMPMVVIRVFPDDDVQDAILEAAEAFYAEMTRKLDQYHSAVRKANLAPTKARKQELEIML